VERLISEGADVNCMNCFGYTPLIEACHRGFINIVNMLIKAGADCNYIPDSDKALESPFINSPPHTALGEAARCGFPKIVKVLFAYVNASYNRNHSFGCCAYIRCSSVSFIKLYGLTWHHLVGAN
jgi:ankyrin repeat protein